MSWVTILWSMNAAACLTLAGVYLVVWTKQRQWWVHLLFASCAVAAAGVAGFELAALRAETTAQYGEILRWAHVPFSILIISVVWFTRRVLEAGRVWLAWVITGLRLTALGLNFYFTPNLNFREITRLERLSWWGGETISVPVGVLNPWTVIGQLSLMCLIVFCVDATITVWRRGDRSRAISLGGTMIFFITIAATQVLLVAWGLLYWPFFVSFAFLGVVAAMAHELSQDVLRAGKLSSDLLDSQQRVQLAAEASRLAVWNWDVARNVVWVSAEGRPFYGIPPHEEISIDRLMETIHPADRKAARAAIDGALESDGKFSAEYRVVLPDGSVRWISALGRADFHCDGQPHQLRGVSLDVTEHKRAELEALQHRNELTHLSRVTMLGELSGSLAHELNQPLTAILSNAQAAQRFLARDPVDLSEVREILDDIVTQDRRAGEVIHRLRLLLKKGEVLQQPLDTNEVVLDVMKLVRSDLVNHHVSAEADLESDLPAVLGDRVQLQQVLLNLVMNACDAMSDSDFSARRITVRTERANDGRVAVEVRDRGRGVPVEGLEQVFEPFYTTKAKGLGLGLSVCRTIIGAHGGALNARNNPEGGATFRFTLPVANGVAG